MNTNRQKKRQLKSSVILAIYTIVLFNSLIIYDAFVSGWVVFSNMLLLINIIATVILIYDKIK